MGNFDIVPLLGTIIPNLLPLFLIILCCLTAFDFYGKLLNMFGYKSFNNSYSEDGI